MMEMKLDSAPVQALDSLKISKAIWDGLLLGRAPVLSIKSLKCSASSVYRIDIQSEVFGWFMAGTGAITYHTLQSAVLASPIFASLFY